MYADTYNVNMSMRMLALKHISKYLLEITPLFGIRCNSIYVLICPSARETMSSFSCCSTNPEKHSFLPLRMEIPYYLWFLYGKVSMVMPHSPSFICTCSRLCFCSHRKPQVGSSRQTLFSRFAHQIHAVAANFQIKTATSRVPDYERKWARSPHTSH